MLRFLNSISILGAVVGIWLSQWLLGIYSGFSHGASKMCDFSFALLAADGSRHWWSHMDPYSNSAVWYRSLGFAFIAFVFFKLIERGRITVMFGFAPLGLSIFFWIWADNIKNLDINDPDKYLEVLRLTTTHHQIILGLIVFLLIAQLATIFVYFKKHKITQALTELE